MLAALSMQEWICLHFLLALGGVVKEALAPINLCNGLVGRVSSITICAGILSLNYSIVGIAIALFVQLIPRGDHRFSAQDQIGLTVCPRGLPVPVGLVALQRYSLHLDIEKTELRPEPGHKTASRMPTVGKAPLLRFSTFPPPCAQTRDSAFTEAIDS